VVAKRKKRKLRHKPRRPVTVTPADTSSANPLRAYQAAFVDWTRTTGLAEQTAKTRESALDHFIRWADPRGLTRPQEITRAILERYQAYLFHYRKADGAALAFSTQTARLNPLKAFFKWLAREHHILYNPASELILPKLPRRLPQVVLSVAEVEAILAQPDVSTLSGVRDRAILETLYSTGIRRMELANLKVYDLNAAHGTLMIRLGKGSKDRVVPIGERALLWITKYLDDVHPRLVGPRDDGTLFLTDYGEAFEKNRLGDLVKRLIAHAGVTAHGACHLFRHACATHMLENGADIRFIQALLGHAELSTTQIYTQVSIVKLKAIHAATHPARVKRPGSAAEISDGPNPAPTPSDARSALLAALSAERDEVDPAAS
jgi:integrase/recombinase XerD